MSGTPNDPSQPRPWGAPFDGAQGRPAPNPYAPPAMPDALGVPPLPPPPPSVPAYGSPPQYPAAAQNFAPMGYGIPPPPPPPPGMGMPDFGIPRPNSGKATASLVCAGVGVVGGFVCMVPALAIPIGLMLGFMGIAETGPTGTRSGRGLAITGTILNAVLLVAAIVGVIAFAGLITRGRHQRDESFALQTETDLEKIRTRLHEYYEKNNNSLGAGGPKLAHANAYSSNGSAPVSKAKVRDVLKLEDLFGEGELSMQLSMYELTITGNASCNVRVNSWDRRQSRVMKVFDIGLGQFTVTDE